jgi:hypothetical protein
MKFWICQRCSKIPLGSMTWTPSRVGTPAFWEGKKLLVSFSILHSETIIRHRCFLQSLEAKVCCIRTSAGDSFNFLMSHTGFKNFQPYLVRIETFADFLRETHLKPYSLRQISQVPLNQGFGLLPYLSPVNLVSQMTRHAEMTAQNSQRTYSKRWIT